MKETAQPWWKLVAADDFTIPAPTGSWGTSTTDVIYTGDHGTKWLVYPDGWPSTYTNGRPGYAPSKVLSVHDSVLDYSLANINGFAMGANPTPVLNSGSQYQAYGKYALRANFGAVPGYHAAFLLWPPMDSDYQACESDYPEFDLGTPSVYAFAHYGGSGAQDYYTAPVSSGKWHTFEQVWKPGLRSYYLDGALLGTSRNSVWLQGQRWQLQLEPGAHAPGGTGHVLVDWIAVYGYTP